MALSGHLAFMKYSVVTVNSLFIIGSIIMIIFRINEDSRTTTTAGNLVGGDQQQDESSSSEHEEHHHQDHEYRHHNRAGQQETAFPSSSTAIIALLNTTAHSMSDDLLGGVGRESMRPIANNNGHQSDYDDPSVAYTSSTATKDQDAEIDSPTSSTITPQVPHNGTGSEGSPPPPSPDKKFEDVVTLAITALVAFMGLIGAWREWCCPLIIFAVLLSIAFLMRVILLFKQDPSILNQYKSNATLESLMIYMEVFFALIELILAIFSFRISCAMASFGSHPRHHHRHHSPSHHHHFRHRRRGADRTEAGGGGPETTNTVLMDTLKVYRVSRLGGTGGGTDEMVGRGPLGFGRLRSGTASSGDADVYNVSIMSTTEAPTFENTIRDDDDDDDEQEDQGRIETAVGGDLNNEIGTKV